jgi:hypothetical protein
MELVAASKTTEEETKVKINSCSRRISFVCTKEKFYLTRLNNSENICGRN